MLKLNHTRIWRSMAIAAVVALTTLAINPGDARGQAVEKVAVAQQSAHMGQLEGAAFTAASRDYAELEPVARAATQVQAMRSVSPTCNGNGSTNS